jgi:hypothetical protein
MYFYFFLIPIFGQLLVFGYFARLNKHLIEGNKDGFPYLGSTKQNIVSGFRFVVITFIIIILSSLILLIVYSLFFLISVGLANILFYVLLFFMVLIVPLIYLRYFETETFRVFFDINFFRSFFVKNALSYFITIVKDICQKLIYLLFPAIFLFGISYFYLISVPTTYDLVGMMICIVGAAVSLFIFLPVFFLSFFEMYSMYYGEIIEDN